MKYRLLLDGADAPPGPVWAVGALYSEPGRARSLARRLGDRTPADSACIGPVAYVPELDMLAQVYPVDRRLPALAALAGGPSAEVAAQLERDAGIEHGSWASEPVRYRPGLGAVLRWSLAGTAAEATRASAVYYAKLVADPDAELHALRAGRVVRGFTVPRVAMVLPGAHAMVLAEQGGTPLDLLVADGDLPAVRVAARALAAFNTGPEPASRDHPREAILAGFRRAAATVACARPDLAATIGGVGAAIAVTLPDAPPGPAHCDLKPDHVLLGPNGPALVDLGSYAAADPVVDPATLLARLHGLPYEQGVRADRAAQATDAFAQEYFALVPSAWARRVSPLYAGALLELGSSLFRRQVPGWPTAIEALVTEARRALGTSACYPSPNAASTSATSSVSL